MKRFILILAILIPSICSAGIRHINYRGNLDNSLYKIAVQKQATVAFLGGSITEMTGWRNMVQDTLTKLFPDTRFTFIDAGISSLGSTPHAFRFSADVLAKGTPDLLFVEACVNDHTNEFGPREQVLGMEGIVRHALRANPSMDIVMLDFIYEPFIPLLAAGETPDVILNHERVANHYRFTSINCAQEISERMLSGELTWEEFGGTHPAPKGHRYYADAVAEVLNHGIKPSYTCVPHSIPEPLDTFCYENGEFVSVDRATSLKGFRIDELWHPSDGIALRKGFYDVPVLSCDAGGSFRFHFDGRAVGLVCMCGPDAAVIEYSIDGSPFKQLDTYTHWSRTLYLPWVYVLGDSLKAGHHSLTVRVPKHTARSGLHIRNFVVNR